MRVSCHRPGWPEIHIKPPASASQECSDSQGTHPATCLNSISNILKCGRKSQVGQNSSMVSFQNLVHFIIASTCTMFLGNIFHKMSENCVIKERKIQNTSDQYWVSIMDITYCLQSALVHHITMLSFHPWLGEDAAQVLRSGGSSGEGPIISHC